MTTDVIPQWGPEISARDTLQPAGEALDAVLASVPADEDLEWGARLQSAVQALTAAIAEHNASAEAEDGTLPEIVSLKPDLSSKVERQKREHAELHARAVELEAEIAEALAFKRIDGSMLHLASVVLRETLRLHLLRGANLYYEAHFRDEGGESG